MYLSLEIETEAAEAFWGERNVLPWMSPTYDPNDNNRYNRFYRHTHTFPHVTVTSPSHSPRWDSSTVTSPESSLPTCDNQGAVPNTTTYSQVVQ